MRESGDLVSKAIGTLIGVVRDHVYSYLTCSLNH